MTLYVGCKPSMQMFINIKYSCLHIYAICLKRTYDLMFGFDNSRPTFTVSYVLHVMPIYTLCI